MKRVLCSVLSLFLVSVLSAETTVKSSVPEEMYGGFPISNFAIAAQVPDDGSVYGHIIRNTGKLGGWLETCGSVQLSLRKAGVSYSLKDFRVKDLHRDFPIVHNSYQDSRIVKAALDVETFCPITAQDAEETALPAIMLQIELKASASEKFTLSIDPDLKEGEILSFIADCAYTQKDNGGIDIPVSLAKAGTSRIRVVISFHDPSWISSKRFDDAEQVACYIFPRWDLLKKNTELFGASLPYTGDQGIDKYLQYYLLPSLILTRLSSKDEALTMGYCELNQRDSFWTSWMHLVLFRDLEWKMITESFDNMRPSGKIPTCILPEIERWDDLDINLFLILRTARYYAMYRNRAQLKQLWPELCRCMDWVSGRDLEHIGIPQQQSFWCDWKDVDYMKDRKYSPFAALLYLASLDQMKKMAEVCSDKERAEHYAELYDKAYMTVNRSTSEGGLWNGEFYAQIWKDGSAREYLAQDQMVGVLYGVVPQDRAESIIHSLDTKSLTPYGVCNMWPYMPGVTDAEATYHNGAMWPWMSFLDCWARIEAGHKDEAVSLIKNVFKVDLIDSGDYVPNEHINTLTGENLGFAIQGWNADLFGLMFFGLNNNGLKFKL